MLKITKNALARLQTTLQEARLTELDCLRIVVGDGGPALILDQEQPGDITLERDGELLLVIDESTANYYYGRILDVDDATSLLVLI